MTKLLLITAALVACMQQYANATEFDISTCKMDVVFTLDHSGSLGYLDDIYTPDPESQNPKNWRLIKKFTQELVKQINVSPDGSHVGLIDFGGWATIRMGLNDNEDEVIEQAGNMVYFGDTTNTTDALAKSRLALTDPQYGPRSGVPKVVVLVTDGNPDDVEYLSTSRVFEEAQTCRDAGIRLIVVGITKHANEDVMRKISYTTNDYVKVDTFDQLDNVKQMIITEDTCTAILTTTTKKPAPTTTPKPPPKTPEATEEPVSTPTTPRPTTTSKRPTVKPVPPPTDRPPVHLPECDYPHIVIF